MAKGKRFERGESSRYAKGMVTAHIARANVKDTIGEELAQQEGELDVYFADKKIGKGAFGPLQKGADSLFAIMQLDVDTEPLAREVWQQIRDAGSSRSAGVSMGCKIAYAEAAAGEHLPRFQFETVSGAQADAQDGADQEGDDDAK